MFEMRQTISDFS